MHTCKRLITVVTIFSFLDICQTDSVAALGHVLAEQSASSTPICVAPDGVGYTWAEFSLSLPILLFSSFLPLSQSVVTVIMQLTLISLLLIYKCRLLELEIEFTRQRLGIETRVEAAQVCLLLRPHH